MRPVNNVVHSFSSLEALKRSEVDFNLLKAGLVVDGKKYSVSAADDGQLSVLPEEKKAKMKNFFSRTDRLLEPKAQAEKIARILNEKRSVMPHLRRVGQTHISRTQFNVADLEGASTSASAPRVRIPDGTKLVASLVDLAREAQTSRASTSSDIYKLFEAKVPAGHSMSQSQQAEYVEKLKNLGREKGIVVWPQKWGFVPVDRFFNEHPNAGEEFFRITRPGADVNADDNKARLTISVTPAYASDMAELAARIVARNPNVDATVGGPELFGKRTDTVIFYLNDDYDAARQLAAQIGTFFPKDALFNHTPSGMHAISSGISYSERAEGDSSSHGGSRSAVIASALADKSIASLQKKLEKAFEKAGYNPSNPAFRL